MYNHLNDELMIVWGGGSYIHSTISKKREFRRVLVEKCYVKRPPLPSIRGIEEDEQEEGRRLCRELKLEGKIAQGI